MNILIVYDSWFGNTEKIAQAMGQALKEEKAEVKHVDKIDISKLSNLDLLVVGSPTHGGKASVNTQKLLNQLSENTLQGVNIATFDTRFDPQQHGIFLRLLTGLIGYAVSKIDKQLTKLGGKTIGQPQGFIVLDKKGPLKKGESKRAQQWVKKVVDKI
jgi:flavodoxin